MCVAWVFFRAPDFETAFAFVGKMLLGSANPSTIGGLRALTAATVIAAMFVGQWLLRDTPQEVLWRRLPWWLRSTVLAVLLGAVILAPGDERAFLYFQF